jgi:hypothetical protein
MASLFQQLNLFIWLGFIVQIVGRFAAHSAPGEAGALIGLAISLVGLVIFIWGCMQMAMEKGYSKWLGLLGFFSCIGLLILMVLPEKS